jgi:hypothetical protein
MEPFFLWSANGYPIEVPSLTYYRLFEDLLIFASSGADFHVSKLAVVALISLAGVLSYCSLRMMKFGFLSSFIVGLFYLSTPLVFNRVLAGHLPYLFAYALMPLVMAFFVLGMREKSLRKALLAGVLFAFAISQLQFIIMIFVLAVAATTLYISRIRNIGPLKYLIVTIAFAIGMHSFWLVPYFASSNQSSLETIAPSGYQDIINAPTVQQAISLMGYPHQYDYSRILSSENQAFLVLPALIGFAAFAFKETNPLWRDLRILGIIAILIGIFLVTATKSPFGELWSFLYDNVSLMRMFREAYHAAALISFGIFILMAITIERVTSVLSKKKVIPVFATLSVVIILLAHPIYSGNFSGQLQNHDFPIAYDMESYNIDYDGSRLLMIPSIDPVRYNSLEKAHIDPMLSYPPGHSFPQTATPDNRLSQYRNFLLAEIDDADLINELQIVNVGTVVVRKDVSSAYFDLVPKNPEGIPYLTIESMNDKLATKFEKLHENDKVAIYKAPSEGFFQMSQNLTLVSGNYKVLGSILRLTDSSVVLAADLLLDERLADLLKNKMNHGTIVVQGDQMHEFFIAYSQNKEIFLPTSENLLPSVGWTSTPLATWWKEEFLHQPSPYNNIVFNTGESDNDYLEQKINLKKGDTYRMFVHLFDNRNGGSLRFSIDGKSFEEETESRLDRFSWRELGNITLSQGVHTLALENVRGFNAVNAISLIPSDEYEQSRTQFLNSLKDMEIVYVFDGDSDLFAEGSSTFENTDTSTPVPLILENTFREIEIVREGFYYLSLTGEGTFIVKVDDTSFIVNQSLPGYSGPHMLYLGQGIHRLEITHPDVANEANDLSFDGRDSVLSDYWSLESVEDFVLDAKVDDNYDLTLEASTSTSDRHWSWIRSAPVSVEGNKEYLITTRMSFQNTNASHIKLEGYYPDSGDWRQLNPFVAGGGTGSSEWKDYSSAIKVPGNVTDIRVVLNAGWVLDESMGDAITRFDDVQIYKIEDLPVLDSALLYTNSADNTDPPLLLGERPGHVISYHETNPTLWTAELNAKEPFILSFAEGYDPRWEATILKDGKEVATAESIPLYSAINGFQVEETGDLKISVQYKPQVSYTFGTGVAMLTIVAGLSYFGYAFFRENVSKLQQAEGA